jgi:predicted HTH domain antitoxin
MSAFRLEIPEDVLAQVRIGPGELEETLRRELAVQLYCRGLLPKPAARRLSGMDRIEFDGLLGRRGIPSELTEEDFESDLQNLADWRRSGERQAP